MNWLAHLLLSEPDPGFRIGNLLPDLIPMSDLTNAHAMFQDGIGRHRLIDAFTDAHPLFRQSVRRFEVPYRRYGGILVDIFYDHFLTIDWALYSTEPLPSFINSVYQQFADNWTQLPTAAQPALRQMQIDNWLGSYGDLAGLRNTLARVSARLRRPFDLTAAVSLLEQDYAAFRDDFRNFFPQLLEVVSRSPSS
jgi:acyl carrier protein phosphodiesterase